VYKTEGDFLAVIKKNHPAYFSMIVGDLSTSLAAQVNTAGPEYRIAAERVEQAILSASDFIVDEGQFTFDAEGSEATHSRCPSHPTPDSGVTVGRGYDMKKKSSGKIYTDMISAGLSQTTAYVYSMAAGLTGAEADAFVNANAASLGEITPAQQKALFLISYDEAENDVMRICKKPSTVAAYGPVDWEQLDLRIKDILVDLRFRGDYNHRSRLIIQSIVSANDLDRFRDAMAKRSNWPDVLREAPERFALRVDYLNASIVN
jgi:hypothetical protein